MEALLISSLVALVSLGGFAAAPASTDSIVASLYPQRLIDIEAQAVLEGDWPARHSQAWAALTPQGDILAAAYANGGFGDVLLLKVSNGVGSVLGEVYERGMGDDDPSIETLDLNGDGKLDFIVTFRTSQGRSISDWVFLFDGTSITSATPLDDMGLSELQFSDPIDLAVRYT